jgi:hypothetical protein
MVIAMMSVILGICVANFGALIAFMFQTNARFTSLETRFDGRIDGVDGRIDALGARLDARIDALAARLDARLDGMDQRLRVVEARPT